MNLLALDDSEAARWVCSHASETFAKEPAKELVLGVRPEKISLADGGLPADVLGLEYLGADSLIACKVGNREWIIRESGKIQLSAGARVHLTWPAAETHWFQSRTGKRRGV